MKLWESSEVVGLGISKARGGRFLSSLSTLSLHSYTNLDGRCPGLLSPGQIKPGTYKLSFDTERYWKERGQESFYPYVEVRGMGVWSRWALTHCDHNQVLQPGLLQVRDRLAPSPPRVVVSE